MTIRHWILQPDTTFRRGDPLCEVDVDGTTVIVRADTDPLDICYPYWHLVGQGEEVRPSGFLLEYSDNGFLGPHARRQAPVRRQPLRRRDRYPRIFLSYRRDDSEAYAGRLHETLGRVFGEADVFMDQFSIFPGEHFEWTIQQAVSHAAVLICIIGPRWLDAAGDPPRRRIDRDSDILRREITSALDRGTPIIPLIVPRGVIPAHANLPDDMRELSDLQMQEISARHWEADVKRLVEEIQRVIEVRLPG